MAIEYNIQDDLGTVTGANTYDSTANLLQYWENRGVDLSIYTAEEQQIGMINAWSYLDQRWEFRGYRLAEDQTTDWPRTGVTNCRGDVVEGVPQFIKDAQFEYAARYLSSGTLITDTTDIDAINGRITKERVGPIEVGYKGGISAVGSWPSYPTADNLIKSSCTVSNSGGESTIYRA